MKPSTSPPPGVWRRITASCPDSAEIYITLTNQMTLPPGALNQCHRLRWNIEKAFDQQEQKLNERKAWSASEAGKRIQAIAMSIVHNLLRLFEAKLKSEEDIQDTTDLTKRPRICRRGEQVQFLQIRGFVRPSGFVSFPGRR
jgi:hypothetical protein